MASRSRVLAGVFALALAAVALTGCTARPASGHVSPASDPAVGACWAASVSTIQGDSSWGSGSSIPCTERHDLYTYAVPDLAGTFTGGLYDSDNYLKQQIADAAYTACEAEQTKQFASLANHEFRVAFSFFLPSESAWKAGERWVRCDLSLMTFGTLLSKPHYDALPAIASTFLTGIAGAAKHYELCLTTSEAVSEDSDPLNAKSATIADCADDPQWRVGAVKYYPDGADVPFPGIDALDKVANDICGPAEEGGIIVITYEPSADTWANGDRIVDCWRGDATGSDSTGANA